jgi:excisionase family DNA binding protein
MQSVADAPLIPIGIKDVQQCERVRRNEVLLQEVAELLTVKETAALLRCSKASVYRLAQIGELPGACKVGNLVRVHRRQLLKALGLEAEA